MSPHKTGAAVLLGTLFAVHAAFAALPFRPVGRIVMGITSPAAPEFFKTAHLSGFIVGGGIGKELGVRNELTLEFGYSSFSLDVQGYFSSLGLTDQEEIESSATGGDAGISTLFLHFKSKFPPQGDNRFVPYLFAEGGLFHYQQDAIRYYGPIGKDRTEPGASTTALGAGLGIGMNIAIEEHSTLFADIGFKTGFTKGNATSFFPFRFGVTFR
ncbi:MAG TPA: hypothetical protein PLG50_03695 [bacterium]|nr:hypothetical protein [bacterium]HQG44739.1 hypothetical protein [bacterium]HQJ65325.1 hypothetical protein [bacterium]